MKILHTISGLQKSSGGPSSCTYELVRALDQIGTSTEILTMAPRDPAEEVVANADFIHFVDNDALPYGISRNFHRALWRKYGGFDLYHVNGLWRFADYETMRFCRKNHLPYVVTLHGMLYPFALSIRKNTKKLLRKLFYNAVLQHAGCIHVTCDEELKHYRDLGFTNPVAVIPNCLTRPENVAALRSARNRKKRIVFLGRIHPIKNIDLVLKAWANALGTRDAEFVISGDGDAQYRNFLQSLVRSLQLSNVIFTGFVSGEEKLRLLADARSVVLASKMENFGMSVPEALMVGTPVLAGDQTPWRMLPSRHCGWYVPTTEGALAKAFSEILSLPEAEIEAMGEAGIRYWEDTFDSALVAPKMRNLYCWMLHQGKKPDFINLN